MKKHNTTIKAFILLLLTAFSFTASAYDFYATASSGQRIYFNILSDSTVSVTYPRFYNNSYYYGFTKPTGNLIIPSTVTQNSQLYHVVSIGANAFYSCTGLTAVSIPSSVTIINDGAFNHCSGPLRCPRTPRLRTTLTAMWPSKAAHLFTPLPCPTHSP